MTDRWPGPIEWTGSPPDGAGEGAAGGKGIDSVLEMAAGLLTATGHRAVLREMLEPLRHLLGADEIVLALEDGEGTGFLVLRIEIGSGRETDEWVPRRGDNPIGRVGRTGELMWRNQVETDVRFPRPAGAPGGSEILCPIGARRRPWGVLGCRKGEPFAFRAADVERFRRFARVAEVAINRVQRYRRLGRQAFRDGLTGLLNRGSFDPLLAGEIERCQRFRLRTTLLLMDVDDFKQINDTFGHPVGDRVLAGIASILQRLLRRSDQVSRYGGEEFAVLLPQTALLGGAQAAGKVRAEVEAERWGRRGVAAPKRVTVSIGVSEYPGAARSAGDLVRSADQALYRAKSAGKNRVERAEFLP